MARPPLAPAAFFCAVVSPCDESLRRVREPDALPPRLDAPGEFAIFAARSFDIPLSFSASYCFSFFTLGLLPGMDTSVGSTDIEIRLLQPGEENVVRALATYDGPGNPEGLLADPRTLMLAAFDGDEPVGFVLAHELPRRHGDRSNLFIYEVDVAETHQRRGIGKALLAQLAELARERGIRVGFVLTNHDNVPANALYGSAGRASSRGVVEWEILYEDD